MIIGIDPGMTGAIAFLDGISDHVLVFDMPTVKDKGGKNKTNIPALAQILRDNAQGGTVKLEKVGPMPKQGVTSVWTFGEGYGAIQGVVQTLGLPLELVTPQAWKKAAGLLKTDKDYARTRALQLYPGASLHRKKDIGRADAILIARYG